MSKIIIKMGVEAETEERKFLPLIGEVKLKYGFPTNLETLELIQHEFQSSYDINLIIARLVGLQERHYQKFSLQ